MAKNAVYVGAKEEQYRSIYGYQKFRFPVKDAVTGQTIGWIKQEVVPGLDGEPDTECYYEKNGWRQQGFPRFYQSPEALLEYVGCTIDWQKNDAENGVSTRGKKVKSKAKPAKPRAKKVQEIGKFAVAA